MRETRKVSRYAELSGLPYSAWLKQMLVVYGAARRPVPRNVFEFIVPMHPFHFRASVRYLRHLGYLDRADNGDYKISRCGMDALVANGFVKGESERHHLDIGAKVRNWRDRVERELSAVGESNV